MSAKRNYPSNFRAADFAVDWSTNLGIAKIDLGLAQLSLCSFDLRCEGALGREGRINIGLRAIASRQQGLGALERQLGISMLRLQLLHRRMAGLNLRLIRGLLEAVKQVTLVDLGTLHKELLLEECGDPGDERDPPDRLDAADELVALGYLLVLGAHHANRRRATGRRLSLGPGRKQTGGKGH